MIYKTLGERGVGGITVTSKGENRESVKERLREWGGSGGGDVAMYHGNGRCELQILIAGR